MDKFLIKGPSILKGEVIISGSKNAALPILASTLLFDKPVIIKNLPRVRDINTMLNLLKSLGSKIEFFDNRKKVRISKSKKPISIHELQEKVWSYQSDIETHTVETHIYRLRKKILNTFSDNEFIISKKNGYQIK